MKQVMNHNKDNGLLNMIRRTDTMIFISLRIITISAKTASCFAEYFVYLQRISKMTRL